MIQTRSAVPASSLWECRILIALVNNIMKITFKLKKRPLYRPLYTVGSLQAYSIVSLRLIPLYKGIDFNT